MEAPVPDETLNTSTTTLLAPAMCDEHIYAGDLKPVTLAPGQYGHTAYFTPFAQTYTSTFSVTDSNNDWYLDHRSCRCLWIVNTRLVGSDL